MAVFLISYDLRTPGRNYTSLHEALRSVPFAHPLESVWLIDAAATAAQVRDWLKSFVDSNDELLVIEQKRGTQWASNNINKQSTDWMLLKLP